MDNQKFLKLLAAHEWNDVEFKEAKKKRYQRMPMNLFPLLPIPGEGIWYLV